MTSTNNRPPFKGEKRKLVIAIDFGTTYSGVSYAFLEPRQVPRIQSVQNYNGQQDQELNTKVPSVLYYDKLGKLRGAGAETTDQEFLFEAAEKGWHKVEWFKFLLQPKEMAPHSADAPVCVLPEGTSIISVLADYFEYLLQATKDFIASSHGNGDALWDEVEDEIEYVFGHPNGWDGVQQVKMRLAAIKAKLITNTDDGRARIHFVSEGEASFHWCVSSGLADNVLKEGSNIVVADAGGGTIDVSSFRVIKPTPLQLEETKASQCHLAGSIFVNRAFRAFLSRHLKEPPFNEQNTIDRAMERFEIQTKRTFRSKSSKTYTQIADSDRNLEPYVKKGTLVINGEQMAEFFERSCDAMVVAIKAQIVGNASTTVFLVGGFAASNWLFSEVKRRLQDHKVEVLRGSSPAGKAVAEGAVGFYLDHYISARVARYTYGIFGATRFNFSNPEHLQRFHYVFEDDVSHDMYVAGRFISILEKGTVVKETEVYRRRLCGEYEKREAQKDVTILQCYKGEQEKIQWVDEDPGGFRMLCTFEALLPPDAMVKQKSRQGNEYWAVPYDVVISFGTTEFKCYMEWTNLQGELQRGPVTAVWDDG